MFWPLSIFSLAVFWLIHRLYTLSKVPIIDLVKVLNIDIPKATKISIDNITDDKIYIHWDLPSASERIVNFVLFVNGKQASVMNGTDSHCFVSNLLPNTRYKVDLVCINNKGFKAKSDPVYIKTKSKELKDHPNKLLLENPENLFKILTNNADVSTIHKVMGPISNGDSRAQRSRSNTVNSLNNENATTAGSIHNLPDPNVMEDIEELRYFLESGQEELHNVLKQQLQTISEFQEQENMLIDERDKLRERKRLEDGNRQAMRSEIKMLDDTRRLTELRKSKHESFLNAKIKAIKRMEDELESWNSKISEFESKKLETENSEDRIHNDLDNDIQAKRDIIKGLQSDIASLDDKVKISVHQKKTLEQLKPKLLKIFKTLHDHTDQGGCIDAEGLKNLEVLRSISEETYKNLNAEIDIDTKLEAEWRAQQQREVNHCLKVAKAHDALRYENKSLRGGWIPQVEHPSIAPAPSDNTSPQSQYPIPITNTTSNLNFGNIASETTASQQQHSIHTSISPAYSQTPVLWNPFSNNSNSNTGLMLMTKLSDSSNEEAEEIESPSVNRFLPADLIGDDFSDLLSPTRKVNDTNGGSFQDSLSLNHLATFKTQLNDSSANLSTRSIFHGDFGVTSPPRFSLEGPTSPSHSYHNDFLSAQNSPSGNDIQSILSGGASSNPQLPALQPEPAQKESYLNQFSPRRLSNVFSFGMKSKQHESDDQQNNDGINKSEHPLTIPSSSTPFKPQSKFFHKSGSSQKGSADSSQPFFNFAQTDQNNSSGIFNTFDSLWHGSNFKNSTNLVSASVNPTQSNNNTLEKDTESWAKFHNGNSSHLTFMNESHFRDDQSDTITREKSNELGIPVALTNTKNSSNTASVKSLKSSSESTTAQSPSFFRKKIFPFGGNNNGSSTIDKSPTKSTGLFRTVSPTKIDQTEDSSIEDYHPQGSRKLFSRNRKASTQSIRKQSNSSSLEEGVLLEGSSIQSNSTTNSRSLVRKLSFFGGKGGNTSNHKDIDDIEEHIEDESDKE